MKDKKKEWDKVRKLLRYKVLEELYKTGFKSISKTFDLLREEYIEQASRYISDPEQSWKVFKGKLLEDVIENLLVKVIKEELRLSVIKGDKIEKTLESNLGECLAKVKRSLLVDFGESGMHLPDADLIIYDSKKCKALAIISSKATLRERIAQTGYWKLKLLQDEVTKHIKVFFITPDEDGTLKTKIPAKKGRAIVETDTDGSYVMSKEKIEESEKVKSFDKFIEDLKKIIDTTSKTP